MTYIIALAIAWFSLSIAAMALFSWWFNPSSFVELEEDDFILSESVDSAQELESERRQKC